jgi:hypothetical protein
MVTYLKTINLFIIMSKIMSKIIKIMILAELIKNLKNNNVQSL